MSENSIIKDATEEYLSSSDKDNPPSFEEIEDTLTALIRAKITTENAYRDKGDKIRTLQRLPVISIAHILLFMYEFRCINWMGEDTERAKMLLAVYNEDGSKAGTYSIADDLIAKIAQRLNAQIDAKGLNEIKRILQNSAEIAEPCKDPNLIAVNNGIFHYTKKQLMPFSEKYVFLTKCPVDYVPQALCPIIHNNNDNTDWDVDSWIADLFDDPEREQLIWEVLGALIRPSASWDKAILFYSTTGNNGKGSLCALMRNLCGKKNSVSLTLSDMAAQFMLEPLLHVSSIITDENNVGGYIEKSANFKALVTHDELTINRKYKEPIAFQFFGLVIQCINELPKIRDKSDSLYRRLLPIPFDKCFTGQERKYIKHDYLERPEVLEYVLHKVLHMNYYEFSEPKACTELLREYKRFNDPVRDFVEELLPKCQWDLLPNEFLYDLYVAWFDRNNRSGTLIGRNTFLEDLRKIVAEGDDWIHDGRQYIAAPRMSSPELLIADYDLVRWYNPWYSGSDLDKKCIPDVGNKKYRSLVRKAAYTTYGTDDNSSNADDESSKN